MNDRTLRGTGRRVLVVEDDAGIREMVALALRSEGYDVDVSDGRTITHPIEADVVLLDFRLDGRTADRLIDEVPDLRDRPIVVMTAITDARLARDAIAAVGVVQKPFDLRVLSDNLRTALDGRAVATGEDGEET